MEIHLSHAEVDILLSLIYQHKKISTTDSKGIQLLTQIENKICDKATNIYPGLLDELNYEILHMLDDQSLFRALRVNKKTVELASSDVFWKNRILRVYGVHVNKPHRNLSDTFYKTLYCDLINPLNNKLCVAIEYGILPLVQYWYPLMQKICGQHVTNQYRSLAEAISNATIHSHNSVVVFLFDKMSTITKDRVKEYIKYNEIAISGNFDIIELLIEKLSSLPLDCYKNLYRHRHNHLSRIRQILTKAHSKNLSDVDLFCILVAVKDYKYLESFYSNYNGREILDYWFLRLEEGLFDNLDVAKIILKNVSFDDLFSFPNYNWKIKIYQYWHQLNPAPFTTDMLYKCIRVGTLDEIIEIISENCLKSKYTDRIVDICLNRINPVDNTIYWKLSHDKLITLCIKNNVIPTRDRIKNIQYLMMEDADLDDLIKETVEYYGIKETSNIME